MATFGEIPPNFQEIVPQKPKTFFEVFPELSGTALPEGMQEKFASLSLETQNNIIPKLQEALSTLDISGMMQTIAQIHAAEMNQEIALFQNGNYG